MGASPDVPDPVAPTAESGAAAPRVLLHMPVDVRSASLGVLAVLATVFTLRWASPVFIPVLLGLMLSYALSPIVNGLHRWRIPRALAAGVLLLGIVGGMGSLLYSLSDDATALIESLPEAAQSCA
jgi:predicted PurR-regulated permease PerM